MGLTRLLDLRKTSLEYPGEYSRGTVPDPDDNSHDHLWDISISNHWIFPNVEAALAGEEGSGGANRED